MKTFVFADVRDAGRSQMAAAWLTQLGDPEGLAALSAGTDPAERVDPEVVLVMREVGIDLLSTAPRALTFALLNEALQRGETVLVTMDAGEACPDVPGVQRLDWSIPDPKDQPLDAVRAIRDTLRHRVRALIDPASEEQPPEQAAQALRGCDLPDHDVFPALDLAALRIPEPAAMGAAAGHRPRILLLYGSLRERSYSRLLAWEAARLLERFGCETRIYDPSGLPLPDGAPASHPKVQALRALSEWSEGQVWVSPERHGAITGVMKSQIDWIPLSIGAVRPTQGRTLAVMQVSGGSQSFNAVNTLRLLGRWMRMVTVPNQSSVAKAYDEFDEAGRMKASPYYDRVVDVMEELVRFTYLTRERVPELGDRYSERREAAQRATAELAAKGTTR